MNKVLVILTGGTICMVKNENGSLNVADEQTFRAHVPEFQQLDIDVEIISFPHLVDSSDVCIDDWIFLSELVQANLSEFDGFVILHGTDTMSYTASALSFMLDGLNKPVVFTGSQLPIGVLRTDARENLLTSIEIAGADISKQHLHEVCIFFEGLLFRANRTTKGNAEHFAAFNSFNYPILAQAGVHINYFTDRMLHDDNQRPLTIHKRFDNNVGILKIFPGISPNFVNHILQTPQLKGLVLETFGAGNAPSYTWLYEALKRAIDHNILIVNKTQCNTGSVDMAIYAVSENLRRAGVISGYDITTEALITKMMLLFGEYNNDLSTIRSLISQPLRGEMTIPS